MKKYFGIFIILIFGGFAVLDLLHPGFAITHDGQDHIARIANFYLNLSQGVIVPRWAANLNWGYGHPILEFLYPFPSYVASFFHFLGFSFIDSTKFVYALAMPVSGIAMYFFIRSLWGEKAGVVSGILYMYTPYRFVDLYVRGDIGEHVAFIFVPLVLWGMYRKRFVLTAIFLALLILSHNAVALMVVPLIVAYGIFLSWEKKWNKKVMLFLGGSLLFGFLLSSFFWVPSLFEGQYTLRNIVTKGEYMTRFVTLPQLLYGAWNYGQTGMFTVQLGIVNWLTLLGGMVLLVRLWKKEKSQSIFVAGLLIYTLAAIFLMLSQSNFIWSKFLLLQNFQFPWRFLTVTTVTTAMLGGFIIKYLPKKAQILGVFLTVLIVFLFSLPMMHAKAYEQQPESFFTGIYDSTTDTGESSPIWSIRFMLHRFDKPMNVISGNAQITPEKRLTTLHTYTVASQGTSRLLENTLYFPGWAVMVDGRPVAVQFQDPAYRGLMTFVVGDGTHEVAVAYHETKLRIVGDVLTVIGIIGLIVFFVRQKFV